MVWFCWCPGQYKPALRQSNPRQVPESSMNASVTAGKRPSMLQTLFVCPVDARLSLPWSSIEGVGRVPGGSKDRYLEHLGTLRPDVVP